MKTCLYLFFLFIIISCGSQRQFKEEADNKSIDLLVGTYTGQGSQGIYLLKFNTETGSLTQKKLMVETSNPSFLAIDRENELVYSVNQHELGKVSSFKWDKENQKLDFIDQQSTHGAGPCYIALNSKGDLLSVANYGSGNVTVFEIADGKISDSPTIFQHVGNGPRADRQAGPHAHYSRFNKDDRIIYVVDLGIDEVIAYPINEGGRIGEGFTALKLDGGDGPRHMAFHPTLDLIFVINELSSTIVSAKVDHETGKLQAIDKASTLPDDYQGENSCADIHVSSDGKYVYASNRGHNSIAIFSVTDDGKLELLNNEPTNGDWPRNFTLSPDGRFLLVANQNSNNITVFKIDKNTGLLTDTGYEADVVNPVCLMFGD